MKDSLQAVLDKRLQTWTVSSEISPIDDSRTVSAGRVGTPQFYGWPGDSTRGMLIVRMKEHRLKVLVYTGLEPEVESQDGSFEVATARIRLDKAAARTVVMDKSVEGEWLFFRQPKAILRELLSHDRLYFEFTPYHSSPSGTTFQLAGLAAVLDSFPAVSSVTPRR